MLPKCAGRCCRSGARKCGVHHNGWRSLNCNWNVCHLTFFATPHIRTHVHQQCPNCRTTETRGKACSCYTSTDSYSCSGAAKARSSRKDAYSSSKIFEGSCRYESLLVACSTQSGDAHLLEIPAASADIDQRSNFRGYRNVRVRAEGSTGAPPRGRSSTVRNGVRSALLRDRSSSRAHAIMCACAFCCPTVALMSETGRLLTLLRSLAGCRALSSGLRSFVHQIRCLLACRPYVPPSYVQPSRLYESNEAVDTDLARENCCVASCDAQLHQGSHMEPGPRPQSGTSCVGRRR
jgi:hypothetical protein